jgi:hypothetical protein
MAKNKKDLIIESFQKMDSTMLEILLDESRTYQDATKEVFLEKLNVAFSNLRENGDTLLSSQKGFCNSNECSNKGCKGYSFVGNNSKNHIDLIFEESDDDIKDIYHCSGFETNDKSVNTETLIDIDISNDEKADFKPSIDFLIKNQNCNSAYEELNQYRNVVIAKDVYLIWLKKFNHLYESFDLPPLFYAGFKKFYWLYSRINELKDFLKSNNAAKEAVGEFDVVDKNNETQLLKWLIKYEETGNNLILFLFEDIDYERPENTEYFKVDDFKINTVDFKYIAKFKCLFDEHYWNMLEKFTTFSPEQQTRYVNENSEMSRNISSLSYHLTKRGFEF